MNYYLQALKNYATFTGRARRKEYWMFLLFNMIFAFLAFGIDMAIGSSLDGLGYGFVYMMYSLAMFIPGLAVSVRRLHDVGKSGWMLFVCLIPIIGGIWLLVLMVSDSEQGDNQYGPNPKQEAVMA